MILHWAPMFSCSRFSASFSSRRSLWLFLCENSVWLIYDLGRISLCFIILFFLEEQKRTETKEASESQFSQISLSAGASTAREGFHTHDSRGSLLVMQCEVIDWLMLDWTLDSRLDRSFWYSRNSISETPRWIFRDNYVQIMILANRFDGRALILFFCFFRFQIEILIMTSLQEFRKNFVEFSKVFV